MDTEKIERRGRPAQPHNNRVITFTMPVSEAERLRALANKQERSMGAVVRLGARAILEGRLVV